MLIKDIALCVSLTSSEQKHGAGNKNAKRECWSQVLFHKLSSCVTSMWKEIALLQRAAFWVSGLRIASLNCCLFWVNNENNLWRERETGPMVQEKENLFGFDSRSLYTKTDRYKLLQQTRYTGDADPNTNYLINTRIPQEMWQFSAWQMRSFFCPKNIPQQLLSKAIGYNLYGFRYFLTEVRGNTVDN
jgi:hypothetical protein